MITNKKTIIENPEHEVALDCIEAAIDAVQPESVTNTTVKLENNILGIADTEYDLTTFDELVVVGGGKAAGGVVNVLGPLLAERLSDSMVVTKHRSGTTDVRCVAGDHPLPTEQNVQATSEILDIVQLADERTLVLFVLTGGASALLTAPAGNLGVADIQNVTEQLLESGVPIDEINAVRKHLSESKGGQVARKAAPATVAGLIMSDVVGNDLSTIGSGPTAPDSTTFSDALTVFQQHNIAPPTLFGRLAEPGILVPRAGQKRTCTRTTLHSARG